MGAPAAAPGLDRPLGTSERFYWLYDQVACANFVVLAELDGPVAPARLTAALAAAQQRHPRLSTRIEVQGRTVRYAPAPGPAIPVADADAGWAAVAARELDALFPAAAAPLVRVRRLPAAGEGEGLLFTFHHAMLDARSAVHLVAEVVGDAVRPEREAGPPQRAERTRAPGPVVGADQLAQEALFPAAGRGLRARWRMIWMLLRGLGEALRGRRARQIPLRGVPPGTPREAGLRTITLDADDTATLAARCRTERTTVHGALCAAQLAALIAELAGDRATWLAVNSAVDLRARLAKPVPDDELGMFISMVPVIHRVGGGRPFWDLAREAAGELARRVDRHEAHAFWCAFPPAWLFPPNDRGVARAARLVDLAPPASIVTNLGRLAPPTGADAEGLRGLHFAIAPPLGNPLVTAATTWRDRLHLNCCFDTARVAPEQAQRIAERLDAALRSVSSG